MRGFRLIGNSVSDLEAGEAGNRDVFAELGDFGLDELIDGHGVVFHEGLVVEADLFVELGHAAFDDFGGNSRACLRR